MDAISLVLAAFTLVPIFIAIVKLTLDRLKDWFRQKNIQATKSEVGFIYQRKMVEGNVKVLQGVLNKAADAITSTQGYHAEELEDKVEKTLAGRELVLLS